MHTMWTQICTQKGNLSSYIKSVHTREKAYKNRWCGHGVEICAKVDSKKKTLNSNPTSVHIGEKPHEYTV